MCREKWAYVLEVSSFHGFRLSLKFTWTQGDLRISTVTPEGQVWIGDVVSLPVFECII